MQPQPKFIQKRDEKSPLSAYSYRIPQSVSFHRLADFSEKRFSGLFDLLNYLYLRLNSFRRLLSLWQEQWMLEFKPYKIKLHF